MLGTADVASTLDRFGGDDFLCLEALVAGDETTMLSLSLAVPRAERLGRNVKGFFAERFAGKKNGEDEQGVRRA